ncbi:MAG: substrate-binding domain-containing protein [Defluviitaleaceae bacterium]|nr:substrate-binding domain-containing protein [Defluviitaleaceae bacterium]
MMQKIFILIAVVFVLTACGRDTVPQEYEQVIPATPTPAPTPAVPTPAPIVSEGYRHLVFEDGIRQFAMGLIVPNHLDPERSWERSRGHQGGQILVFEGWDETVDNAWRRYLFEMSEGTGYLDSWTRFDGYEFWTGAIPRLSWVQPDAPTDVFVTQHGLTVVRYEHVSYEWEGWDISAEEIRNWDWDDSSPPRRYADYVTAVYFFRQDGSDVREGNAQVFFYVIAFAHEGSFAELDMAVRGVLDSLYFYDVPPISLTTSEEAMALGIDGTNFPRINGSTSTIPLVQQIFMSMFEHTSNRARDDRHIGMWDWSPYWIQGAARTIPSYELLIGNYVDMILVPEPSVAALQLAEDAGVALEFTPIAVEALVFLTSAENPVSDITHEQLMAIYSDRSITNWTQLGGLDGAIVPLNRNLHSGSQTLMDNLILRQEEMHESLYPYQIGGMEDMLTAINYAWVLHDAPPNTFTIGYTVYYFLEQQRGFGWNLDNVRVMSFEGVTPSQATIASGEYILTTHYYAVIRADSSEGSPERILRDWMTSEEGQNTIERATLGRIQ